MSTPPSHAMIVNDDGTPRGVADIDRIQSDATLLMYDMAAAAGDDDAVDAVAIEWTQKLDPDSMGYTSATALSLLARNILGPVLEVLDQLAPHLDFRGKLVESRDQAREALR
ncbi:hypothetical protein HQO84_16730 [Rhodococcus fascians]|nr:hypothetical protein [Rhodococcus fascians]MBY3998814.1 hypothetical protein [Rhodococcus fascians]MBY4003590.1 hypothetical protein [Rhodococcus fascians]MBY4008340.1 hypothetical protein [Rhodococcus fascians]MBY4018473.1 hypothetical protein [Rhodococcus fascians]